MRISRLEPRVSAGSSRGRSFGSSIRCYCKRPAAVSARPSSSGSPYSKLAARRAARCDGTPSSTSTTLTESRSSPNAGSSKHPAWYHNLRAHPDVTLAGIPMRATVVTDEATRRRLWTPADRVFGPFAKYRRDAAKANLCRQAIPSHGRLLSIHALVPETGPYSRKDVAILTTDMGMLVGGRAGSEPRDRSGISTARRASA